jgi:hypothetical protein
MRNGEIHEWTYDEDNEAWVTDLDDGDYLAVKAGPNWDPPLMMIIN